jgi:hypothetical protein
MRRLSHCKKRHHYSITSSRATEQRDRHGEAERLGGLEVDHELKSRRPLDRQIGGFLALENPTGVAPDLAIGLVAAAA